MSVLGTGLALAGLVHIYGHLFHTYDNELLLMGSPNHKPYNLDFLSY